MCYLIGESDSCFVGTAMLLMNNYEKAHLFCGDRDASYEQL